MITVVKIVWARVENIGKIRKYAQNSTFNYQIFIEFAEVYGSEKESFETVRG